MGRYLAQRVAHACLVVLGVSVLVFCISRLSGDPVSLMLPMDAPRSERIRIMHELGLDKPIYVQYLTYLKRLITGDLGQSIRYRQPVIELIAQNLPNTLQLAGISLTLAVGIGVPLGIWAGFKQDSLVDRGLMVITTAGQSVASFWLASLLILFLGVRWRLLPISGSGTLLHLIMPALTLALRPAIVFARLTRSSVREVLPQDFIQVARAKGLAQTQILGKHVLKNAAIPIVTVLGMELGVLLGGAVITEQIFGWPGIGTLSIQAIYTRDFPVIQAVTLLVSTMVVLANLLVDLVYLWLNPQVRLGGES